MARFVDFGSRMWNKYIHKFGKSGDAETNKLKTAIFWSSMTTKSCTKKEIYLRLLRDELALLLLQKDREWYGHFLVPKYSLFVDYWINDPRFIGLYNRRQTETMLFDTYKEAVAYRDKYTITDEVGIYGAADQLTSNKDVYMNMIRDEIGAVSSDTEHEPRYIFLYYEVANKEYYDRENAEKHAKNKNTKVKEYYYSPVLATYN